MPEEPSRRTFHEHTPGTGVRPSEWIRSAPPADGRMPLAGGAIADTTAGTGPAVLLIHGLGGTWRRLITPLARTHTVIAPDLPDLPDLQTAVDDPDSAAWGHVEVGQPTGMLVAPLDATRAVALVRLRALAYATHPQAERIRRTDMPCREG